MDMGCLMSYREGFPNIVLEAAASGVPMVAKDVTGTRDAVVHGQTGILVKGRRARAADRSLAAVTVKTKHCEEKRMAKRRESG